MQGVPLAAVMELMGHRSIAITMRYAHLAPRPPEGERRAVNAIRGAGEGRERGRQNACGRRS